MKGKWLYWNVVFWLVVFVVFPFVLTTKATPWIHCKKKVVLSSGKTQLKMGKQSGDHTCVGKSLKVHKTCCFNNRAPYRHHRWFIEVLSNLILFCHPQQASLGGASESTWDLAMKTFNWRSQTFVSSCLLINSLVSFQNHQWCIFTEYWQRKIRLVQCL